MSYLVREDGVRFVIPSYRDVLAAKQKSQLKQEILALSQNYGGYITLQHKNDNQYEVTFSPDRGYLLGESVWHYFKHPVDMVYCEAVPNTTEAILVIVKAGSVYLDGRFPLEGIQEELVIFLTQKNNFNIYVYGEVPISEHPIEGKFSFDSESIKSFNILTKPIFSSLPLLKIYELQLVEAVLKAHGIGTVPVKKILTGVGILILGWAIYTYLNEPDTMPVVNILPIEINPYEEYQTLLASPAPEAQLNEMVDKLALLITMPGWQANNVKYIKNDIVAIVVTPGSKIQALLDWAKQNDATVAIKTGGIEVTFTTSLPNREKPQTIYPIQEVITKLVDRMFSVYPGNHLSLALTNKTNFTNARITLSLNGVTFTLLRIIAQQFEGLPIVLSEMTLAVNNGMVSGSIIFEALGSST